MSLDNTSMDIEALVNIINTNVTNALFVGSTAELQKMIKKAGQNINS